MKTIDLNADVGETPESLEVDIALVSIVTSANIACGGHAGDPDSMSRVVRACLAAGCSIGAHPSYPDRAGFGRSDAGLGPVEIRDCVAGQVDALARIARSLGAAVSHVKPHGALYHAAAASVDVADAVSDAVLRLDPGMILVGRAGSAGVRRWRSRGLLAKEECFADRSYEADGSLTPRGHPQAVVMDPVAASARAVRMVVQNEIQTRDGVVIPLHPDTICVHSDTPGAVEMAMAVRSALVSAGVRVVSPAGLRQG